MLVLVFENCILNCALMLLKINLEGVLSFTNVGDPLLFLNVYLVVNDCRKICPKQREYQRKKNVCVYKRENEKCRKKKKYSCNLFATSIKFLSIFTLGYGSMYCLLHL